MSRKIFLFAILSGAGIFIGLYLDGYLNKIFHKDMVLKEMEEEAYNAAVSKDYDRLDSITTEALQLDPENLYILTLIGSKYYFKRKFEEALQYGIKANTIDSTYKEAIYLLAITYYELKEYEKAYPCLNKYLAIDSSMAYLYELRGSIHLDREEYERAAWDYLKAIQLAPNSKDYSNRSLALIELERYEEAFTDLSEAIALDSNNAYAYNNMATISLKQKQPALAIYPLQKSLELEPNNAYLMKNFALYYEQIGKEDSVCISLRSIEDLQFYEEVKEMTDNLSNQYCK